MPSCFQHGVGKLRGALTLGEADAGAALHDRLVKQAFCLRHGEQGADLSAAARLTEDRDIAGIAADARRVVAHPLQRQHQVEHADVAGLREALAANCRQIEMAEDVEAMVDRDDHDVVAPCEVVLS
jgi:hypothetical protein